MGSGGFGQRSAALGTAEEVKIGDRGKFSAWVCCPLCSCEDSAPAFTRADNGTVVQCKKCALLYLNPRSPEFSIASLYDRSYFDEGGHGSGYRDYIRQQAIEMKRGDHPAQLALQLLEQRISPRGRTLLDVGCGGGDLLNLARRHGFGVSGVDVSAYVAAQARERFNLDVFADGLEDAKFDANSFDVVTALEVVEHLTRPVQWLREVYRILKPCGLLLLTTPNAHCAAKYGEKWLGFTASFEHLTFFDLRTVTLAAEMAGLRTTAVWTRGNGLSSASSVVGRVVGNAKRILKRALLSFPSLFALLQARRRPIGVTPFERDPFGHDLWVLLEKVDAGKF